MLKFLFNKSIDSIKLGVDGLLKIITGLIVIKIISNIGDDSLLANFSQLKMLSALLISITSSAFIIGLNKLSMKYARNDFIGNMNFLIFTISVAIILVIVFFEGKLSALMGRRTECFLFLSFLLLISGYLANYFLGCKIASLNNKLLSSAKIYSTTLSFFAFLSVYFVGVNVWLGLYIYIISYYVFLALFLFDKNEVKNLFFSFSINVNVLKDAINIIFLTFLSSVVFPSCIVYLRYDMSTLYGWEYVSFWEAEWQLSSL
ncbi:hypothetical protein V9N50_003309, partial [Vibrio cholerae]